MHKLRSDLPFSTRQGRVRSICAARPPLGLDDQRRPPARALNFARPVRGAQLELFQIYKLADFHDGRGRAVLPMTPIRLRWHRSCVHAALERGDII